MGIYVIIMVSNLVCSMGHGIRLGIRHGMGCDMFAPINKSIILKKSIF
jgi:hypothetical protein